MANVWEHRVAYPTMEPPPDNVAPVESQFHPRLVVMSVDCDLLWDHDARDRGETEHPIILPYVLLLPLYEENEIKDRITGSDLWKRIRQNQDERYHHLVGGPIGGSTTPQLPHLYMDFKKIVPLPTERLYEALDSSQISRIAVLPPVHLEDLMHRFYSFHGRVSVPD